MQAIKRFFVYPLCGLLLLGVLWACDEEFLEVEPRGSLNNAILSTSADGIDGTLIGAYSQLPARGSWYGGASNWLHGSIQGGEANKGSDDGDQNIANEVVRYQLTPTSVIPDTRWEQMFKGVTRANVPLRLLNEAPEGTVTEAQRRTITGEARFLRGHYYFQLKISYDQAPYLSENLTLEEAQRVASSRDIWDEIEADFRYGYENLPETQNDLGRAHKWAAGAYLGKTLIYQEKWDEARTVLRDVVENGVTTSGEPFELLDNYADAFNAEFDNSSESVFATQAAVNTGTPLNANWEFILNFPHNTGSDGPGNCCGFFQPSFDLVNSFRTQDGLPLLDNSYNDNALVNDQGLAREADFTPDAGPVDPRLDHSVGRRGIPYLGWGPHPGISFIRDQTYAGPYSPKKFVYTANQEGSLTDGTSWTRGLSAVNYNIIRFSDVLLLLAEAEIQTGNLDAGRELINRVRARVADPASWIMNEDGTPAANYRIELYGSFADRDEALQALYFERKMELSGEGHRFFDLRRWGLAEEELNRIIDHERQFLPVAYAGAAFSAPQDLFYPIPLEQIELVGSDLLPQNPGY